MKCPKCAAAMELVTAEGVTVDRCTGCGGIWFDGKERERLLDAAGAEEVDTGARRGAGMDGVRSIRCPRCGVEMSAMEAGDVPVIRYEGCASCKGAFLDAGEFRELGFMKFLGYWVGMFGRKKTGDRSQ